FYWVNVPGLAALFILILVFIVHLLAGSDTEESAEAMALNEYIVNYYLSVK
ncbi:MAG TPA: hypothetical protein ENO05_06060, partial [Bacteroides sp.]|nr:hypothetical protein [Bacteroides sp.]